MNRTLKFPRTEENYVIVLSKIKNGMSIQKFDHNGNDVTIKPNMYNLNEVIHALMNEYQIEIE